MTIVFDVLVFAMQTVKECGDLVMLRIGQKIAASIDCRARIREATMYICFRGYKP
jgi:hypothetical protein